MSDDLNRVMRSATENLHPNIGKLTTGGIERGVRKRRFRRMSQIAGAAAGVTAVFGAVAVVGSTGHGTSASVSAASGDQAVAAAHTGPTGGAAHTPTAVPSTPATSGASGSSSHPAAPPVSGDDMAKWLRDALKPYHFTGEQVLYDGGSDQAPGPFATMKIGYASGDGSLALTVSQESWSSQSIQGTLPYITVTNLPDGSHLMVFDGPEWPAGNGDPSAKRLDVAWYRTDGTLVDVMVLNAVQEKGTTTASGLGLTVDQATKLVQSPVWDKAIAAVLSNPPNGMPKNAAAPSSPGQDNIKGGAKTPDPTGAKVK